MVVRIFKVFVIWKEKLKKEKTTSFSFYKEDNAIKI